MSNPAPKGAYLVWVPMDRLWEVRDEDGRVLHRWATKRAATDDMYRYLRAEREERR